MGKFSGMKWIKHFYGILLLPLLLSGCESEYQQYVNRELGSGLLQDSLIFDMRMGQTKKEFYTTCWELNKQQVILAGSGNRTARYVADQDSLGNASEAKEMLFYGVFDDNDTMRGMEMTYSYITWAPWNRERQSDSLLQVLKRQYMKGYPGNEFIEIDVEHLDHPALVKIDGNRQILMYPKNKKDVLVRIEDLRYKFNK